MIQNVCNKKMDKIDKKVVDPLEEWNKSKREYGGSQKKITK